MLAKRPSLDPAQADARLEAERVEDWARMQLQLPRADYERLRWLAFSHRMKMSEWIRLALRKSFDEAEQSQTK